MSEVFSSYRFKCGIEAKNRFFLAPMTNQQSYEDGTLHEDEKRWLAMRGEGGFSVVSTCASHVLPQGKGFAGQLGCFSDDHLKGLTAVAESLNKQNCISMIQLHHGGIRCPEKLINQTPMGPSEITENDVYARSMTEEEIVEAQEAFITSAVRAEKAGFKSIQLHGAHNYLISQFLSPHYNRRNDSWGGSFEGRIKLLMDIVTGLDKTLKKETMVSVRLSPENTHIPLEETLELYKILSAHPRIDNLDVSLWDSFKYPQGQESGSKKLIEYFTELKSHNTALSVAGKIYTPQDVQQILDYGADFVSLGRVAIGNHDFPNQMRNNEQFQPKREPYTEEYLREEGLGDKFIAYMKRWDGFVA